MAEKVERTKVNNQNKQSNMRRTLASLMHWVGRIAGVAGGLALVGAWIAGEGGSLLGASQTNLYINAAILTLIGISAFLCSLLYLKESESR